jgi:hypothetical protein
MDETDEEVEDFFDRISGAGETKFVNEVLNGIEEDYVCHAKSPHHTFSMAEPHHRPQAEILTDQDDGPAHIRRCFHHELDRTSLLVVQRPIPFKATTVSFDTDEQRYRLEVQDLDWYNSILERYLDAGYGPRSDTLGNVASVVGILHSLPPDLAEVLKEGLHALHVLRGAQASRPQAATEPSVATNELTGHIAAMEDDMWERNEQCGYLRFEWDPVTERRRCVPRLARAWHAHAVPSTHLRVPSLSCSIPRRRTLPPPRVAALASARHPSACLSATGAARRVRRFRGAQASVLPSTTSP